MAKESVRLFTLHATTTQFIAGPFPLDESVRLATYRRIGASLVGR